MLQKQQVKGSKECAEATALLLRRLVESSNCTDAKQLLSDIQIISRKLVAAQPRQMVIGNMARRVLGLIREEIEQDRKPASERPLSESTCDLPEQVTLKNQSSSPLSQDHDLPQTSLFQLLSKQRSRRLSERDGSMRITSSDRNSDASNSAQSICKEVVEGIQELLDELRQVDDQIAAYALEHIHSSEIVVTNSMSKDLIKFLIKAAGKRNFSVVLAENFPNGSSAVYEAVLGVSRKVLSTSQGSKSLSNAGVPVTLVADSAIFGLMPRASKVILTAEAVYADGSCLCASGAKTIAITAHFYKIPVLVLAGVFKISPQYPFNTATLLSNRNAGNQAEDDDRERIGIQNHIDDFLAADLVDLYISNVGAHASSSLSRIINDHYRNADLEI